MRLFFTFVGVLLLPKIGCVASTASSAASWFEMIEGIDPFMAGGLISASACSGGSCGGHGDWRNKSLEAYKKLEDLFYNSEPPKSCTVKVYWYELKILKFFEHGLDYKSSTSPLERVIEKAPRMILGYKPFHVAGVLDCREDRQQGLILGIELFNNGIHVTGPDSLTSVLTHIASNNEFAPGHIFSMGIDFKLSDKKSSRSLQKLKKMVDKEKDKEYNFWNNNCQHFAGKIIRGLSGKDMVKAAENRWELDSDFTL